MTFDQPAHFAGEQVEAFDHDPITGLKLTIDGAVCTPPVSVKGGVWSNSLQFQTCKTYD